ncbi:hypothetical protein [Mycobacterium asiaticum]|uniref:hypothetical protein n=1 Tax=Mycobacterium asiaticum TaxID=1790 RepID=UPI00155F5EFD|nr:hypothetical protein [Mycobacterium asiaticum]
MTTIKKTDTRRRRRRTLAVLLAGSATAVTLSLCSAGPTAQVDEAAPVVGNGGFALDDPQPDPNANPPDPGWSSQSDPGWNADPGWDFQPSP